MRRGFVLAGVWAVGVVIAVTLAFAAVARVANGVAPNDVAHLSQRDIDDELTGGTTTPRPSTPPRSGATTSSSPASTPTSTTSSTFSIVGPRTPTTRGTTLTAPPVTAWSTTTTPTPPATPTTASTTPKPPPVAPHNTVTTSQGGTVYTRCTGPETIAYVAAVPKTGYERTVDIESPTGVKQTFANSHHRSSIQAECSDGVVHAEVEEEADDD